MILRYPALKIDVEFMWHELDVETIHVDARIT